MTLNLILLLELTNLLSFAQNTKQIIIYSDLGTSRESIRHTKKMFSDMLKGYSIIEANANYMINTDWEKKTKLLVIPGGADIPYTKLLNGKGNDKIKEYVKNGGNFLGICAGAYYAGAYVDFARGTDIEVLGDRELKFFNGVVKGPILAPYDYRSNSGAIAAEISWQGGDRSAVYYNGGGCFVEAEKFSNILARYTNKERNAAIVETNYGKGKAILSGVHFEYNPELLSSNDVYIKEIKPKLLAKEKERIELLKFIFSRLGLKF